MKKNGRKGVAGRIRRKRVIALAMALMMLLCSDAVTNAAAVSSNSAASAAASEEKTSAADRTEEKDESPADNSGQEPSGGSEGAGADDTAQEEPEGDAHGSGQTGTPEGEGSGSEQTDAPEEDADGSGQTDAPKEDADGSAGADAPQEDAGGSKPADMLKDDIGSSDTDRPEENNDGSVKENAQTKPAEPAREELVTPISQEELEELLEEFEALPEDEVGAITWKLEEAGASGGRRAARRAPRAQTLPFQLTVQYVNQPDPNQVTMEDNFNLKYQISFTAPDTDIETGDIRIRIPQKLFADRDGSPILTDQIAVQPGAPGAEDDGEGGSTAFKYYIEGSETDDPVLVFYNCRTVEKGTHSIWQVLYKVPDIMQIEDQTSWSLQPEYSVTVRVPKTDDEGNPQTDEDGSPLYASVTEYTTETVGEDEEDRTHCDFPAPLSGTVDTNVRLTSVSKEPYYEPNRQYAPGLYTRAQVAYYAGYGSGGDLPETFSGEKFNDYRYVVWEVTAKGTATQPWNLIVSDRPAVGTGPDGTKTGTPGILVGYRDNSRSSLGYNVPITRPSAPSGTEDTLKSNYGLGENDSRAWGSRFYAVTAYPRDAAPQEETMLCNEITVTMQPIDEKGETAQAEADGDWRCRDYRWDYDGDEITINKYYYDGNNEAGYAGWLDAWQKAKGEGRDYGALPFSTTAVFRGYEWTHAVNSGSGEPGEKIAGRTYRLTVTDDAMYAWPDDKNGRMLTAADYYFTEASVTPSLWDIDIFEDQEMVQDSRKGELKIWAMYGLGGSGAWEEVPLSELTVKGADSGRPVYALGPAALARRPWRIKAEYTADGYRTACTVDVKVCLKKDSPVMNAILTDGIRSVKLEDLSGVTGQYFKDGKAAGEPVYMPDGTGGAGGGGIEVDNEGLANYDGYLIGGKNELQEMTQKLYGGLIYRDNDSKKLNRLTPHAHAAKTSGSINDSAGGRVVVDYHLTAYDGYEVYSREARDYLQSVDLTPGQNHVVFYDLLPYGMMFDPSRPVTAGRIRELDARRNYETQSGLWDTSQVRVEVDPDRDISTDYNGTGRTRVAFHIYYEGADPTVYTNNMWIEGWGVRFSAWYDRKDAELIRKETNVCAFMPGEAGKALIGIRNQDIFPDNGGKNLPASMKEALKAEYRALGSDINGDGGADVGSGLYNVMYADEVTDDDIAQDGQTGITKKVIADADRFGRPARSASVPAGGGYTYEITVGNTGANPQTGLVVYDILESGETEWKGTFRSVDVSGLKAIGIAPKVYYSSSTEPGELAETNTNWISGTGEDGKETPAGMGEIRAVAVDMRRAVDGTEFALKTLQNAGFRIHMKVPEDAAAGSTTGNTASYRADGMMQALFSNPASVKVSPMQTLTVTKQFASNVPSAVRDAAAGTPFEFQLYRLERDENGKEVRRTLGVQRYTLWEGETQKDSRLYATDGSGRFRLRAGQTANFQLPDVAGVSVEETKQILWKENPRIDITDNSGAENGRRAVTVTNEYRPTVYVQKLLQGALDTEQGRADAQTEFTFLVETKAPGETEFTPLSGREFYYVDSAGPGIPGPDPNHGATLEACRGMTGSAGDGGENAPAPGCFRLRRGEVAALCFDATGVEYRITEVTDADGRDASGNWICRTKAQTGVTSMEGSAASFTNTYRWKELYLTKNLTHQAPADCTAAFTFRIQRAEVQEDGTERLVPLSAEERQRIRWRPAAAAETESWTPLTDEGTLTSVCAGRTLCVSGLESGVSYKVTELPAAGGDYVQTVPANGEGILVAMPEYGSRRDIGFTNDYRWRDLSVSKTLASGPVSGGSEEPSFPMTVRLGGELQKNVPYKLMKQGQEVPLPEGVSERRTDAQTGEFRLKSGETAVFAKAGKVGDAYVVTEVHTAGEDETYPQLYPAGGQPFADRFPEEELHLTFINGAAGSLYLRKEYVYAAEDTAAAKYLEDLGNRDYEEQETDGERDTDQAEEMDGNRTPALRKTKGAVKVQLFLNGELFTEPCEVTAVGPEGTVYADAWPSLPGEALDDSFYLLEPGYTVVVPESILQKYRQDGELRYELREAEDDRQRLEKFSYSEGKGLSRKTVNAVMELRQKTPADGAGACGSVDENPVAEIVNEIIGHQVNCERRKLMTEDSQPVPEGKKLVWRVERYSGGEWIPAENISYAVLAVQEESGQIVTDEREVRTTGDDGRIELYRKTGRMPVVDFLDLDKKTGGRASSPGGLARGLQQATASTAVYLNLDQNAWEGALRLVELPEESDREWGLLAGYYYERTPIQDIDGTTEEMVYPTAVSDNQFRLNVGEFNREEPMEYSGFVNSNKTLPVEIAKEMESGSDGTFTMLLEQVLLLKQGIMIPDYKWQLQGVIADDILASEARGGIPYQVYLTEDTQDGEAAPEKRPVRTGATGANGEILLHAGEYARLELPEGTLWTVREQEQAGYELKDLRPDSSGGRLAKLNDQKTMLIYQTPSRLPAELQVEIVKDTVYYDQIQWKENPMAPGYVTPAVDLLKEHIRVYGKYTDGTVRELPKGSLEITQMFGDLAAVIRDNDPTDLTWHVRWLDQDGRGTTVTLNYQPVQSLKAEVTERYVLAEDFVRGVDTCRFDPFKRPHVKVQAVYGDGRTCELRSDQAAVHQMSCRYGGTNNDIPLEPDQCGVLFAAENDADLTIQFAPRGVRYPEMPGGDDTVTLRYLVEITEETTLTARDIKSNNIYDANGNRVDFTGTAVTIPSLIRRGQNGSLYRVKAIGTEAFKNNTTIESVTILGGIRDIEVEAFYGCTSLQELSLPESVESIKMRAFGNCKGLKELVIPKSVYNIGISAFAGSGLETVKILPYEPYRNTTESRIGLYLAGDVFTDCEKLKTVIILDVGSCSSGKLFGGTTKVNTLTVLKADGNIKNWFSDLSELRTLTISAQVTGKLNSLSLNKCIALEDFTIIGSPADVTMWGSAYGWPGHTIADIVWQDEYTP